MDLQSGRSVSENRCGLLMSERHRSLTQALRSGPIFIRLITTVRRWWLIALGPTSAVHRGPASTGGVRGCWCQAPEAFLTGPVELLKA